MDYIPKGFLISLDSSKEATGVYYHFLLIVPVWEPKKKVCSVKLCVLFLATDVSSAEEASHSSV